MPINRNMLLHKKNIPAEQRRDGIRGVLNASAIQSPALRHILEHLIENQNRLSGDIDKSNTGLNDDIAEMENKILNAQSIDGKLKGSPDDDVTYYQKNGGWFARNKVFAEDFSGDTGVTLVLANTPITGTVQIYKNGLRLRLTTEYSVSSATITLVLSLAGTEDVVVDYEY